jgi:hypothetical protein
MEYTTVGNYFAFPDTGLIVKLFNILNNEYDLRVDVDKQVFLLNSSQFNKLILVPDIIREILKCPDEVLLTTHKHTVDSFLEKAKLSHYYGDLEFEVLQSWREKLGASSAREASSTSNSDKSLEYGGLYLGGDWREDYDARY